MITRISGTLLEKKAPALVVDVSGIGYELLAPMSTFYQLPNVGDAVTLFTHLSIREDAHVLFGFYEAQERALFRALIKVNGIGPKLALTILSGIEAEQFVRCIQAQDTSSLIRIPGIGKKIAERLIIETRDTLATWQPDSTNNTSMQSHFLGTNQTMEDAVAALTALGYKPHEAKKAIASIHQSDHNSEQLIRLALQKMVRGT